MDFHDLVNGAVGNVLTQKQFNKKYGKDLCAGAEVCDIDGFDFTGCKIDLCREEGYRGEVCYSGVIIKGKKKFFMDIISEGMIYELES